MVILGGWAFLVSEVLLQSEFSREVERRGTLLESAKTPVSHMGVKTSTSQKTIATKKR